MITSIKQKFKELYQVEPLLFRSPGRMNLLGEHIDYNGGIVFPAAIDQYVYIAIGAREDDEIQLHSLDYQTSFKSSIHAIEKVEPIWTQYILGVVDQLQKAGAPLGGFNMVFRGDIAQGAGLSSSAALECAVAFGLQQLYDLSFSRMELAKLAQAAENQFVGVNCGLMDQFGSLFGKEDHFLQLDCESLEYAYFPFDSADYCFVLLDTQVHHSLASSAYNERRQQCEAGLALVKAHDPDVTTLRQVTPEMLTAHVQKQDALLYQRCDFVVSEIKRVQEVGEALLKEDLHRVGQLMFEAHEGLSQAYEVSCAELDFLVDEARQSPAILGARMMGGGFGGCTLNLIRKNALESELNRLSTRYQQTFERDLKHYPVRLSEGTSQVILSNPTLLSQKI